jgi:hypothetical protein
MADDIVPGAENARYTSYRSDKTFSILDHTLRALGKGQVDFEYNGILYSICRDRIVFTSMSKYLMPYRISKPTCLTQFNPEILTDIKQAFEFINTYEIEGKTILWLLEHQKEWKYNLSASHFEKYRGDNFWFVYQKLPAVISGFTITLYPAVTFDVTHYRLSYEAARLTEPHLYWDITPYWQDILYEVCVHPKGKRTASPIQIGPFKNVSELLDIVQLNDKTIRTIFDTEYDDGPNLIGCYVPS